MKINFLKFVFCNNIHSGIGEASIIMTVGQIRNNALRLLREFMVNQDAQF